MNINEYVLYYIQVSRFFLLPFFPRERPVASPTFPMPNIYAQPTSKIREHYKENVALAKSISPAAEKIQIILVDYPRPLS